MIRMLCSDLCSNQDVPVLGPGSEGRLWGIASLWRHRYLICSEWALILERLRVMVKPGEAYEAD